MKRLIQSITHYWRINLAVLLAAAVATAVLTGALLVGDSVRGSLRDLTLERLGNIDGADEVADLAVTVMDTTAFSTGAGHFDAADSASLLAVLGQIATAGGVLEGDGRVGLLAGTVVTVRNATQIIMTPVAAMSGMSN